MAEKTEPAKHEDPPLCPGYRGIGTERCKLCGRQHRRKRRKKKDEKDDQTHR